MLYLEWSTEGYIWSGVLKATSGVSEVLKATSGVKYWSEVLKATSGVKY